MDYTQRANGSTGRASPGDPLAKYDEAGIKMVRVSRASKRAVDTEWQNRELTPEEVRAWVTRGENVGLQVGGVSGWLCVPDPDCPEAEQLAPRFLPGDTLRQAKGGGRPSQYFYRSPELGYEQFRDLNGEVIMDLKASNNGRGHMVVVEPSVHPTKGAYRFVGGFDAAKIAEVPKDDLRAAVGRLAVATLIARHLPERGRHDLALALAGYMLRNGEKTAEVIKILRAAWEVKGAPDEGLRDLERLVSDTARKLKDGEPVKGGRTLESMRQGMPAKIAKFLGWERPEVEDRLALPRSVLGNAERPVVPDPDSVGLTRALADDITAGEHFARDAGGKLWHYSGGTYVQHGERTIGVKVKKRLEDWSLSKKWSSHRANEVVQYIATDAPELWERPPVDRINVLNGILNLETSEMMGHYPEFLSPVQLPVYYDPEAECPAWERFVVKTFPEDARELAFEVPAWLMTPDTSIQKAVLALGEGANGKSVYLAALESFVGRQNTANLPLQKIEGDRFAAARLIGKLANICPDLPSQHLASTSTFKAITGGDPLVAEYKFRDSFDVVPYARLVFSANHPPRSGDASHAFYRRWLVIPFDRTFEPDEQRPRDELDAELADPRELSGVLNRALLAWHRLRAGRGFTESESTRRALEEFRDTTDPLSVWLDRYTLEHADAVAGKDELRRAYAEHCEGRGIPAPSTKAFDGAVRRSKPHLGESQRIYRGVQNTRVWVGLGLRRNLVRDVE